MKNLVSKAHHLLRPLGYRKRRNNFWRIRDQVYTVINFQSGAYGDYFFVNLGVHPVGLPQLITGQLKIPDHPPEVACILRQRVEQAVPVLIPVFRDQGLVSPEDDEIAQKVLSCIGSDVQSWFQVWASLPHLAISPEDELRPLLGVVPILQDKALWLLKTFSAAKSGLSDNAQTYLQKFLSSNVGDCDMSDVDAYVQRVVKEALSAESPPS